MGKADACINSQTSIRAITAASISCYRINDPICTHLPDPVIKRICNIYVSAIIYCNPIRFRKACINSRPTVSRVSLGVNSCQRIDYYMITYFYFSKVNFAKTNLGNFILLDFAPAVKLQFRIPVHGGERQRAVDAVNSTAVHRL